MTSVAPSAMDGIRLCSSTLGAHRPLVPIANRHGANNRGRIAWSKHERSFKVSAFSFTPPGKLTDLASDDLAGWNDRISSFMESSKHGPVGDPRPQFFSQADQALSSQAVSKNITWQAFPKRVKDSTGSALESWQKADSTRDVQDEYCEWSVTRNADNKITKVMFTTEGPEYWTYLAETQPDTVLALYRQHISPDVQKEDLFPGGGDYQPRNKWNQDTISGAMHLIQENNTLSAEIRLAADASIVRNINGQVLTDQQDLIDCSRYGNAGRFSDPSIGVAVNQLAQRGADVTLADPVALYIDSFTPVGFVTPDGVDAMQFWRVTRGAPGFAVRAEFEVPASKPYVVGDIQIGVQNTTIQYGAQIVDFIRIRLTGVADNLGRDPQPADHCAPQSDSNGGAPSLGAPSLGGQLSLTRA